MKIMSRKIDKKNKFSAFIYLALEFEQIVKCINEGKKYPY